MSCRHKFYSELYLEHLDYHPETLIIGTFNPKWPQTNTAAWFYGRTYNKHGRRGNNFWEVLPRIYGEASLIDSGPEAWKPFCRANGIAITDLLSAIEDADELQPSHRKWLVTYSDSTIAAKFAQHVPCKIDLILERHKSIRYVYLTRSGSDPFWKKYWQPVAEYCQRNGLRSQTLLTPSGYAFYQQGRYNREHPDKPIPNLAEYIFRRWKAAWHF